MSTPVVSGVMKLRRCRAVTHHRLRAPRRGVRGANSGWLLWLLLATILMFAGCATTPQTGDGGEAAAGDTAALFADLVPTPERVTHRGITISAPADYRFLHPYGGDVTRDENRDPRGILLHLANEEATLSGSLQLVHMPADEEGAAFLERYRTNYLGGAEATPFEFPSPTTAGAGLLVTPTAQTGELEAMTVLYPLPVWVAESRAVLLELFYPPGNEQLRNEASSIASSIRTPMDRDSLRLHARSFSTAGSPGFEDTSGTWRWVTDVPGGMVVRRDQGENRLYLLIGEAGALSGATGAVTPILPQELEDTGISLEVARGDWNWSLPVARSPGEPRNRYAVIPADPLADSQPLALIIWTPEQIYQASRLTRPEPLSDEVVVESVQSLFDSALLRIDSVSEI